MKYVVALSLGLLTLGASSAGDPPAKGAKTEKPGWKLAWSDEFDGQEIDRTKWDHDVGNGFFNYVANTWISGWGNGELQYYTRDPANAFVKDGMLHIRVLKESLHNCGYTSARLKTRGRDGSALFNKKYGRFEFRAKLPTGQGIWPAIWMLPQDDKYGTWAASGEIDILEARGQEPNKVLGTLHFGSRWPMNAEASKTLVLPDKGTIANFHVYALEWEPGEIRWYVDDRLFSTQSSWWSSSKLDGAKGAKPKTEADLNPWPAPFDQPFYLVMNVAVGGKFLGNPDKTTAFPVEMLVDYVRVYDKVGGYGAPKPRGDGKLPFVQTQGSPVVAIEAKLEKLADGFQFTEGPSVDAKGNVYFTDQPNNRIHKWSIDGKLSTFLEPAGRSNGLCFDAKGDLWACADEKNELWRIDIATGKHTVIVKNYQGKLLNGPNDVWVRPDGGVYFSDPYFKRPYWKRGPSEQDQQAIYFLSPDSQKLTRVTTDLKSTNGLVGTPDGKTLYVTEPSQSRTFRFDIQPDGSLTNKTLYCKQACDGMTLDDQGNVYFAAKGITVFDKAGKQIEHIPVPEPWTANVCFGGADMQTLFITASKSFYGLKMKVKGASRQ